MKLNTLTLLEYALFAIILQSFPLFAIDYKTYPFSELTQRLGYPSVDFFGSTYDEVVAIETYSDKSDVYYKEINSFLRFFPAPYEWYGTSPEQAKILVENIDQIYKRVPSIPQDLILFRGVNLQYRKNVNFKKGETFFDKGYVSTTTRYSVAKDFAIKINIEESPKSKKAIYVIYQNGPDNKAILINQNEDEVLLDHGQLLKIMDMRKSNSHYDIYLVQWCKSLCEQTLNADIIKYWASFHDAD
jgi:hypothetical protein